MKVSKFGVHCIATRGREQNVWMADDADPGKATAFLSDRRAGFATIPEAIELAKRYAKRNPGNTYVVEAFDVDLAEGGMP